MLKKIILLSIVFYGLHGMESNTLEQHKDLLRSLKKDCHFHDDGSEKSFRLNYTHWYKVKLLDKQTKNQLLQKILDSINDPKYLSLRGAIACLVCAGADANQTSTYQDNCALNRAAMYQDYEMAELLLKNGANPNQKIKQGYPIFFWLESKKLAKLFIDYKVDLQARGFANCTIFHGLTRWPRYPASLITFYMQQGLCVHYKDNWGNTPLIDLALNSSNYSSDKHIKELLEKAKLFIENGICVTDQNNYQKSALSVLEQKLREGNNPAAHALKQFLENHEERCNIPFM